MLYVCVYLFFCIRMIKMSYIKSIYYVKAEGCIKPVLNFTMVTCIKSHQQYLTASSFD